MTVRTRTCDMDSSSQAGFPLPLHRGEACLICRRKKMKCDGAKPSCGPCTRAGKGSTCEYEDTRFLVRINELEGQVSTLQQRIRELEGARRRTGQPVAPSLQTAAPFSSFLQKTPAAAAASPELSPMSSNSAGSFNAVTPAPTRVPPALVAQALQASASSTSRPAPASNLPRPVIELHTVLSTQQTVQLATNFLPHAPQFHLPTALITGFLPNLRSEGCPLSESIFALACLLAPPDSVWHSAELARRFFTRAEGASGLVLTPHQRVQAHCLLAGWIENARETWWMVYALDRTWTTVFRLASTAPRDAGISTCFAPQGDDVPGALELLYIAPHYGIIEDGESSDSIRIKALALHAHIYELIASYAPHRHIPQSYWTDFYATTGALNRLANVITESFSASGGPGIASAQIIVYAAIVAQHATVNDREPAVVAIHSIVQVLAVLDAEEYELLEPMVGFCLLNVELYCQKDAVLYPEGDDSLDDCLLVVSLAVQRVSTVFPYLGPGLVPQLHCR
ncbi:hypothetical protein EXIGLDRAFT_698912 [Exidia glandulosa HHB12029]|uniref:Zn(2)-C6 fungal-type domain-containing protein n=1 Tax=Exidia glandulosa HHB12029 TaxID=1314781 RepID=A0A165E2I0_EXIGL|nr:hypothetical protein EXIGLDRAFT_698912 [Exidia glandulosa HHB12029]